MRIPGSSGGLARYFDRSRGAGRSRSSGLSKPPEFLRASDHARASGKAASGMAVLRTANGRARHYLSLTGASLRQLANAPAVDDHEGISRELRLVLYSVAGLVLLALLWAGTFPLAGAVIAAGTVTVDSSVKK